MILWVQSIFVVLWSQLWSLCLMVGDEGCCCCWLHVLLSDCDQEVFAVCQNSTVYFQFNFFWFVFNLTFLRSLFSEKVRRWWQPLWDHHRRGDPLLPASCNNWRKKGVDQSHTSCVKKWKITGAAKQQGDICQPRLLQSYIYSLLWDFFWTYAVFTFLQTSK